MVEFLCFILVLAGRWRYFQKMGHQGWEGVVPISSTYGLFKELYGNGWHFLLLLVPFYNIYVFFKLWIDLAHAFNQSTGFGVGLALAPYVFSSLLGFGNYTYGDGSKTVRCDDAISRELDRLAGEVGETPRYPADRPDDEP